MRKQAPCTVSTLNIEYGVNNLMHVSQTRATTKLDSEINGSRIVHSASRNHIVSFSIHASILAQRIIRYFSNALFEFRFQAIQLNRLNWQDYLDRPNPVAAALMAKMKIVKKDREGESRMFAAFGNAAIKLCEDSINL